MVRKILNNKFVQFAGIIALFIGVIGCIYLPQYELFKWSVEFAVQIMLAYLLLGFIFLFVDQKKLMFASFACCGIMCLYLKGASNENLRLAEENIGPKVSIAHFNVSASTQGYDSLIVKALESEADLLSFLEVTPDWHSILKKKLISDYPYRYSFTRIDLYGTALYSKYPILEKDSFHFEGIPNMVNEIQIADGAKITLINTHLIPPFSKETDKKTKLHLKEIASKIENLDRPVIVAGDFNLVYWSNEIREFRNQAKLFNSRRDIAAAGLKIPYDHIFYTAQFECTKFQEIQDNNGAHLGIFGSYQFRTLYVSEEDVEGLSFNK